MSSKMGQIKSGKIVRPILVLVYGPDGVGKTTFAGSAPNPLFLGTESGTDNMDVARYPEPKTWTDVLFALKDIAENPMSFKTLVIDSLDWMEPLLFSQIIKEDAKGAKTIETACGGYGKGYVEAEKRWVDEFMVGLNKIRNDCGMNIVLVAHSDIVMFPDPQSQTEYKRYELKLHKKASSKFREYVDAVLFANFESFVKKDGQATRTFGDGTRVMFTERRPGYDAKNRYGLPEVLKLGWDQLTDGIKNGQPESVDAIKLRIDGLLSTMPEGDLKKTVIEFVDKAGNNLATLLRVEEKLLKINGETA